MSSQRTTEAVSTVFGLHGLPLPPRKSRVLNADAAAQAAAVTPDVILKQYGVPTGRIGTGSSKNRQAVAEFQGQTMNSTDLKGFFKAYVKDAKAGDDTVSKFVGDAGDKGAQVEASLDIQFMMGVSPGVKTEFWLYNNMGGYWCFSGSFSLFPLSLSLSLCLSLSL